ncbi:hypothetical protein SAMN06893096_103248 [Geodermatophilus pulveris]|uniref:Uncharacterized protein n=1 Tax=Geodermatophilus pulveris TaxID=1564159 RepID=A0A239DMG1_9ACTN|nr:hypothetical protein [Geodermatophilus pulveris]SNS33038.1 hypothetical protein SAMN06893096_103248 [Geodermatophilus pulveris]
MTEYSGGQAAASDTEGLKRQLTENGITDIDSLVQRLVSEVQPRAAEQRIFVCTNNYCVVVKEQ